MSKKFTEDTIEGALINAQLDYDEGEYQRCRTVCDTLLGKEGLDTKSLHEIRFLKADALVELAKRENDDDLRMELYLEAKDEMDIVRSDAEEDYLESLRRLKQIYGELKSHEIEPLSRRYGMKVWQSYLENKKSAAMRMFWVYGPNQQQITIIGLEPHPEDKKNGAYDRIILSDLE